MEVNSNKETDVKALNVRMLLNYLKRTHNYFLDYQFPILRQKLAATIDYSEENDIIYLIFRYFEKYVKEVEHHMKYEEENVFRYVNDLLEGKRPYNSQINNLVSRHHKDIENKFHELKNLFEHYSTNSKNSEKIKDVLTDLCSVEEDLTIHCMVEDNFFVPAVRALKYGDKYDEKPTSPDVNLSDREKDIAICVAKGMSNKEIAEKLFLSVHTITTHRRNIAKKLNIHSPAGITIYCIVNKLVDLKDIDL